MERNKREGLMWKISCQDDVMICKKCDYENPDQQLYCGNCGLKLKKGKGKRKLIAAVLITLLVLSGVLFMLMQMLSF